MQKESESSGHRNVPFLMGAGCAEGPAEPRQAERISTAHTPTRMPTVRAALLPLPCVPFTESHCW